MAFIDKTDEQLKARLGFRVTTTWGYSDRETKIEYDGEACDIIGLSREVQRLWDECRESTKLLDKLWVWFEEHEDLMSDEDFDGILGLKNDIAKYFKHNR